MNTKQLTKKMYTIWDKITSVYFDCLDSNNEISELEQLQVKALMWHAKQVCQTLKELPF